MLRLACIGALLVAAAVSGCGSGDDAGATQPQLKMSAGEIAKLPPLAIRTPHGPAPHGLVVHDVRDGAGAVMKRGDTIVIDWVEVPYFEARGGAPHPPARQLTFSFGKYIEGWEDGLPGMKVGGRRELIVPTRLGDVGTTMIYAIDLLGIEPG